MTSWGNERTAVMMTRRDDLRPTNARQANQTNQSNENEKIAFIAGPTYDFWDSEGDSIYDELYGEEV